MKTAGDLIQEKGGHIYRVPSEMPIEEALRIMIDKHIASLAIEKEDKIVGIWTDQELMRNTLQAGFNPKTAKIGDYMITSVPTAPHTDSVYQLTDKFVGIKVRQLLITKDEEYIGVLSIGDILVNALLEKEQELKALKAEHSFDYYEDWQQWKKKKR